jgi:molecular chaperone GrpE
MTHNKHTNLDEEMRKQQEPAEALSQSTPDNTGESIVLESIPEPVVTVESVKAEMMDRILRLQADFENYRRRTRQEQNDLGTFVTQNLIKELLPVVDNFERALASRPTEDPSGFGAGVEMIFRQLYAVLEKQGVSTVKTVGEMFDPNRHEAILKDAESDKPEGTVVAELQKGYAIGDKVIRPALVKVAGK